MASPATTVFSQSVESTLENKEISNQDEEKSIKSSEDAVIPTHSFNLPAEDPLNPRNWTTTKKVLVNVVLCTYVFALTYTSTAYIASISEIVEKFNISSELAISGVSLYLLGLFIAPPFLGPLSEVVGRRITFIISAVGFTAFSWLGSEAENGATLLVSRFLAGCFGSASINNVPSSIGDFTYPVNRNRYTILYAILSFGGPSIGPITSIFIQEDVGFRWNERVQSIFVTITSLLVMLVPETHSPTLQRKKLRKEGFIVENPSLFKALKIALQRPIVFLFTEPIVTLISIYLSALYGILYGFFEVFGLVFVEVRGFSQNEYAATYVGLALGFITGAFFLATVGDTLYARGHRIAVKAGVPTPPEARLGLAYFGAIISPISLFLFAWTAPFPSVHWIFPVIAEGLFSMSMLFIFTAFIPYLIDVYATYAASALSTGMASRALVGAAFPLFALEMYHKLSIQGATSLLGGFAIILAPIPFLFLKFGPRLREKSKYSG